MMAADGVVLGDSWADFLTKNLNAGILTPSGGQLQNTDRVWTGTARDGRATSLNCKAWTSASSSDEGTYGHAHLTNSGGWTNFGATDCDNQRHLYCFSARIAPTTTSTTTTTTTTTAVTSTVATTAAAPVSAPAPGTSTNGNAAAGTTAPATTNGNAAEPANTTPSPGNPPTQSGTAAPGQSTGNTDDAPHNGDLTSSTDSDASTNDDNATQSTQQGTEAIVRRRKLA